MNLHEHPSPETDKMDNLRCESRKLFEKSRDLERRLAACRVALLRIRRAARSAESDWQEKPSVRAAVIGDIVAIAQISGEALSITEPKP